MVDFSSVNLRILSPDGKTVLADLQTLDRAAVGMAKRASVATTASLSTIQKQAAVSTRAIAGNVAQIAAMGEAGAGALKGIISQGANLAFMFGTGGAVAGAIAVTGLAIFNFFDRTRKEIEDTARTAALALQRISRGDDLGAAAGRFGRAAFLFGGERDAVRAKDESEFAFESRRLGIEGIKQKIIELRAEVKKLNEQSGVLGRGGSETDQALKDWEKELARVRAEYDAIMGIVARLSAEAGRTAAAMVAPLERERAKAAARAADVAQRFPGLSAAIPGGIGVTPDLGAADRFGKQTQEMIVRGLNNMPVIGPQQLTPWQQRVEALGDQLSVTLSDGIVAGIMTAVESGNIGKAFGALAGTVLTGIGDMAIQVGTEALVFAKLWGALKIWLVANPVAAVPVALGLIAFGGALKGLGARMGGSGGGFPSGNAGGGGASAGAGGDTIIDRGLVNPLNGLVTSPGVITQRGSVTYAPTIIGTHDAAAQRAIVRMMELGLARSGRTI